VWRVRDSNVGSLRNGLTVGHLRESDQCERNITADGGHKHDASLAMAGPLRGLLELRPRRTFCPGALPRSAQHGDHAQGDTVGQLAR
jgi:hypothetical protein